MPENLDERPVTPRLDERYIREIEYGDDPADAIRKYRFYMRLNTKARIAILDQKVYRASVHFNRTYMYCLGEDCPFCQIKPASPRYMTWIAMYATNDQGVMSDPMQASIKGFLFGRDKYSFLAGIKEEWGDLRSLDLIAECTDEKFQRMSIVAAKPPARWTANREFALSLIAAKNDLMKEIDVNSFIAKAVPREQMVRMLMGDNSATPSGGEAPSLITAPESGAPVSANSAAELQALLDQLDK